MFTSKEKNEENEKRTEIDRPSKNFTAEQKRERQGSQRTKERTLKKNKAEVDERWAWAFLEVGLKGSQKGCVNVIFFPITSIR